MQQQPRVILDWGIDAVKFAAKKRYIVVINDTLRFSSAIVTAITKGFTIYPVSDKKKGMLLAASVGATMAGRPHQTKFSISPVSFLNASCNDNRKLVLFSPNGAVCSEAIGKAGIGYIGCLLNAKAVGEFVTKLARKTSQNIAIIAAGEQRDITSGDRITYTKKSGRIIFALEDYLGCGAIISYISLPKTVEARVCESAFQVSRKNLQKYLFECFSGQWLIQHNMREDVKHAAQLNHYNVVPAVVNGKIELAK